MFVIALVLSIQYVAGFTLRMGTFSRDQVLAPFIHGNAFKVISGLTNFNSENVKNVVIAAQRGGASHVDIACDAELVRLAKSSCKLPVCVSAVVPESFLPAVVAGADMIEIGNFDSFYDEGIIFTAEDIIKMTQKTRFLLPSTVLSVTIPYNLPLHEQVELAKSLEKCGVDIIQTEGKVTANTAGMGVQQLIETAAPTLATTFAISRAVSIPVMCASGLTDITAPLAFQMGARGIGIGSMVNKLPSVQQMAMAVSAVADAIGRTTITVEHVDAQISTPYDSGVKSRMSA